MSGLILAASLRLLVWPPSDQAKPTDAVVALAGGDGDRLEVARNLVRAHPAAVLVLSVGADPTVDALCAEPSRSYLRCFQANPFRTSGEARSIGELAGAHGWDSLAVVTSRYHLTRARLLVGQCTDARLLMIEAGGKGRVPFTRLVREWGGLIGAFTFDRAC